MKTKSTTNKPNLPGFTQANGKTTSMVFKAFCYDDFCPVQSISTLSKGVINKPFSVSLQKPTSIRMTPSERDTQPNTSQGRESPSTCCHAGWVHTKNQIRS